MVKFRAKGILGSLFLILFCGVISAQDLSNFTTLKCGGSIPDEFVKLSQDKVKADYAINENNELDKDFFLSSRFFIDELLLSGRILFNEEISNYLNKVAKYTLRSEKELMEELRFYVLKSNSVNAFSTDQGIIVFTTGLLAQLENEAQLAYIIAHEVSHFTEKHVRSSYIEKKTLKKGIGKYQQMNYESRIKELSIYEQSTELLADKKGIDIFLKTEYEVEEVFTSFEMLLYSYLPFNEVKFDSAFFNTDKMIVPGSYFPDTIRPVTLEDDFDDDLSSHPNIKKRLDAALESIGERKSRGALKFKISETDFYKVQALARFEGINIRLSEREYGRALYEVFLLNQIYTQNRFLDLCKVKALYGLAKYKNANRYSEVVEKPKNIEGESFPLHLFLYDLGGTEINVIALRHAYDMTLKYPKDAIFKLYFEDLKKEIALHSRFDYKSLKDKPYDLYAETMEKKGLEFNIEDSIDRVEASDLSKYQKIRIKKELRAIEESMNDTSKANYAFYEFALYDLVEAGLIADLDKIKSNATAAADESSKEKEDERVAKIVVIDPIYRDYNLKNKQNLEKSENKKIRLSNAYTQPYRNLNLEVEMIDSKDLSKDNVDKYNDLGLVFQWLIEVLDHDNIDMITSTHDQMDGLTNRYGTDEFLFTGIYAFKERNEANFNHLLWAMTVYGLPFVLVDLLIIHNYFDMVSFSINATTDHTNFVEVNEVNLKASSKIIDVYIYDVLNQINKGVK